MTGYKVVVSSDRACLAKRRIEDFWTAWVVRMCFLVTGIFQVLFQV